MRLTDHEINIIDNLSLDILKRAYRNEKIKPPIQIDKIFKSEDISLQVGEFEEDDIAVIFQRKKKVIYASKDLDYSLRAIAIAFGLGDYFLHNIDEDIVLKEDLINPFEEELDELDEKSLVFSSGILMPRYLVFRYWKEFKNPSNFAHFFKVTNSFSYFRLNLLNLSQDNNE